MKQRRTTNIYSCALTSPEPNVYVRTPDVTRASVGVNLCQHFKWLEVYSPCNITIKPLIIYHKKVKQLKPVTNTWPSRFHLLELTGKLCNIFFLVNLAYK